MQQLGRVVPGPAGHHRRWIFYVNPPICLAAIVLALRYLPRETGERTHDLCGSFAMAEPELAGDVV